MNVLYDASAKAPNDVTITGQGPLILSLPVEEVEVGRMIILTTTWEVHQADYDGAVVVQVAPVPFVYGGPPANWAIGISRLPPGFAVPIEVGGTTVCARQGWSSSVSTFVEVLSKADNGPFVLGMYGWAYPRGAVFMGGACEVRVRVLG